MKQFSVFFISLLFVLSGFAANVRDLHVATYNISVPSKYDADRGNGWDERCNYVCGLIGVEDFDIIGMQEVTHEQIEQILAHLPQLDYVGEGRNGGTEGEYSPIFYNKNRFRLQKSGTFWLSTTPDSVSYGWDAECRRICTYAKLYDRKTGKVIWHFNTHLDHKGATARNESIRLILSKIESMAGKLAHVIITGDFNARPTTECYEIAQDSGRMVDSRTIAKIKYEPSISTYNGFDTSKDTGTYIDYIFVRPNAVVNTWGIHSVVYWSQTGSRFPSDHHAVSVRIRY